MFGGLFSGKGRQDREEGSRLFRLGVEAAQREDYRTAFDFYTLSIKACDNPSPLMNRASIYSTRWRHYEALVDYQMALKLDRQQGRQFIKDIEASIIAEELRTANYSNGLREKLVEDLKKSGDAHVVQRITSVSFEIDPSDWEKGTFDHKYIEYHFFNDIDSIAKFEVSDQYKGVAGYIRAYPRSYVEGKVSSAPGRDMEFWEIEQKLRSCLCSYNVTDMARVRQGILHTIHRKLLRRDFGPSDQKAQQNARLIKEAEAWIT